MSKINVSREVISKLNEYKAILQKWNKVINLVSKNTLDDIWERHINDSLQLLKCLDIYENVCDVGSGAGLPGIILSIAGVKNVTLIESDQRKSSFLLQASKLSSNKIIIINDRVENINSSFDVVTSRAFAELSVIFSKVRAKRYLLLKGTSFEKEVQKAKLEWSFDCQIYKSLTSSNSVILDITNVKKLDENKYYIHS
jgi:16S rRNA (guanine527-N7)-methyltransferase